MSYPYRDSNRSVVTVPTTLTSHYVTLRYDHCSVHRAAPLTVMLYIQSVYVCTFKSSPVPARHNTPF
jgi:hypothetical protein